MNVLIAPDKFKGTLTAEQVCTAIESGLHTSNHHFKIRKFPLADGGEGTLEVFRWHTEADTLEVAVHDPLMRPILASYLISNDRCTAFIEMAQASGLGLLDDQDRNPLSTTTFGTGELIKHALDNQVKKIVLGIGGSATNDAGLGAFVALGGKIYQNGNQLAPNGQSLSLVTDIDLSGLDARLKQCDLTAICDVTNPFYGAAGAAHVFARQKGADSAMLETLDSGLRNVAKIIKKKFAIDLQQIPGAGAGGGLGGGAYSLLSANLRSGTDVVFDLTRLKQAIDWADIVITGEGKLDVQTLHGKLIAGLGAAAQDAGKPMLAVCGTSELTETQAKSVFINKVFSMVAFAGQEQALTNSAVVLERLAANVLSKAILN
jgi:glycerate 2-kinase